MKRTTWTRVRRNMTIIASTSAGEITAIIERFSRIFSRVLSVNKQRSLLANALQVGNSGSWSQASKRSAAKFIDEVDELPSDLRLLKLWVRQFMANAACFEFLQACCVFQIKLWHGMRLHLRHPFSKSMIQLGISNTGVLDTRCPRYKVAALQRFLRNNKHSHTGTEMLVIAQTTHLRARKRITRTRSCFATRSFRYKIEGPPRSDPCSEDPCFLFGKNKVCV